MRVLIADIVSGLRPAGEMLPREVDMAVEFDVSRGVVRETIRAMEERGLISVKHGKGATVNGPESWDVFDPDVLDATLDTEQGATVLAEYLECRRMLEVPAAGVAAERASKADIARIAEAFARMEATTSRPPGAAAEELFHEADVAFHQALIAATGNRPLAGLIERLHSVLVLARYPLARPRYRQDRALPEHQRILDAITTGDSAEAQAAMSDHLDTIAGYLGEYRRAPKRKRAAAATSS
jgi:GntR family transcriptional repressor for pyruvate dehydrogenase complex